VSRCSDSNEDNQNDREARFFHPNHPFPVRIMVY
jgi:hypothetical protein